MNFDKTFLDFKEFLEHNIDIYSHYYYRGLLVHSGPGMLATPCTNRKIRPGPRPSPQSHAHASTLPLLLRRHLDLARFR